jgi:phospholipase/carboxylesterase
MTAHADDPWKGRWFAPHELPSMELHERKPWDTLVPASLAADEEPHAIEGGASLEIAVAGADAPWGHFSLPDESPVHLPPNYEPNYAYPLIIWLHDEEWTARELLDLMPRISPQSYLGLAIEGLTPTNRFASGPMSPTGSLDPLDGLLETLKDVARQMRREFHVHSERIYLAGFGDQASVALRMLLRRPEWFAGALAFGLRDPKLDSALANYDELRGKRVFLSAGVRDPRVSMPDVTSVGRLLRSFGIQAVLRAYDSSESPTPKLLSDIDRWLMHGVCESTLV